MWIIKRITLFTWGGGEGWEWTPVICLSWPIGLGNGPLGLGNGPLGLGNGLYMLGNGLHGLGNGPYLLGNGSDMLGIMSQFGIMSHSALCRIRGYVVRHNVAFGSMSHSALCRSAICRSA